MSTEPKHTVTALKDLDILRAMRYCHLGLITPEELAYVTDLRLAELILAQPEGS